MSPLGLSLHIVSKIKFCQKQVRLLFFQFARISLWLSHKPRVFSEFFMLKILNIFFFSNDFRQIVPWKTRMFPIVYFYKIYDLHLSEHRINILRKTHSKTDSRSVNHPRLLMYYVILFNVQCVLLSICVFMQIFPDIKYISNMYLQRPDSLEIVT